MFSMVAGCAFDAGINFEKERNKKKLRFGKSGQK